MTDVLRPMAPADEAAVLALNAAAIEQTGPMDAALFQRLLEIGGESVVVERDGRLAGCLIVLADTAPHDGENFRWFAERVRSFLYVDRIVVAERERGRQLGRLLYEHAAQRAADLGLRWIAAEVNAEPPNTTSLAFHARHGFVEIATRVLSEEKVVSYQLRAL